ncbi:hypothetical protein [Enterobacter hormaechei]|uniref:hypothetical protein n=1 Tax=Enterobacter hormaechei TaxID=158836 RepID=UPI000AF4DDCB|nr:hypothetical protein [Enterobacter hormaechei]
MSTISIKRTLMKAIRPIPSAALARLNAITAIKGQRYCRQTRRSSCMQSNPDKKNQPAV